MKKKKYLHPTMVVKLFKTNNVITMSDGMHSDEFDNEFDLGGK